MIAFIVFLLKTKKCWKSFSIIEVLKEQKGMVVFLASVFLAACGTGSINNVHEALNMVYYTLPFFMLSYVSKTANIKKGILIGLIIVIVAGTAHISFDWLIKNINRPYGLLRHPNNWAFCMGMIIPLFMYYAFKCKDQWVKTCSLLTVGLCIFSLFLVKSRGVNIAILTCATIVGIFFLYKKNRTLGLLLAVLIPCSVYLCHTELLSFLHRGYDGERLLLYKASVKMWLDYPIFGTGFADWRILYNGPYYPAGAKEYLFHSHNTFLHILSASGIVGLFGYLFFLCSFVSKCVRNIKAGRCYAWIGLSAFIVFILHSFVDSSFSIKYIQRFFWLMFFIYQYSEMERHD